MANKTTAELIVALDVQSVQKAMDLAKQLQGVVPWVKVGFELYIQGGSAIVTALKNLGFKIFLDLKMYDIPNTVHGGVLSACKLGVDLLTIHTQGGENMAKAAMQAVAEFTKLSTDEKLSTTPEKQKRPLIFGVTVLTSMKQGDLPLNEGKVEELVLQLAQKAHAFGLDGVVCSGQEVSDIQRLCGKEFLCLTPGIRPLPQENQDDQCRIMTPQEAVRVGAHFLVVGRPIIMAADPAKAARDILQAMAAEV